jgi:hypothetical protein
MPRFGLITAQECYRRALDARRMAVATGDPDEKADFLAVEQGWLALARRYELDARLKANAKVERDRESAESSTPLPVF